MHVCFLLYLKLCVLRNIKLLFLTLFLTTAVASPLFGFSQQVKDAQVLLNSLGFDAGPEDGLDDRKTKIALIEFYAAQQKTFDGQLSDNELFDLINFINAKALKERPETVRYEEQESAGNYFVIILFFGLLAFVLFILRKKKHKPHPNFTPQPILRSFSRNPNNALKPQAKQIPAITGKCHVVDGDTIHIGKHKIRLAGINAPEQDEPYGQQAKWALVNLCKGQVITAYPDGEKSYERIVATCFLDDGRDLAAETIKHKVVLVY